MERFKIATAIVIVLMAYLLLSPEKSKNCWASESGDTFEDEQQVKEFLGFIKRVNDNMIVTFRIDEQQISKLWELYDIDVGHSSYAYQIQRADNLTYSGTIRKVC